MYGLKNPFERFKIKTKGPALPMHGLLFDKWLPVTFQNGLPLLSN